MMMQAGCTDDVPMVWSYLELKVAPFIENLFNEAKGSGATHSVHSLWGDLETVFANPKKER